MPCRWLSDGFLAWIWPGGKIGRGWWRTRRALPSWIGPGGFWTQGGRGGSTPPLPGCKRPRAVNRRRCSSTHPSSWTTPAASGRARPRWASGTAAGRSAPTPQTPAPRGGPASGCAAGWKQWAGSIPMAWMARRPVDGPSASATRTRPLVGAPELGYDTERPRYKRKPPGFAGRPMASRARRLLRHDYPAAGGAEQRRSAAAAGLASGHAAAGSTSTRWTRVR